MGVAEALRDLEHGVVHLLQGIDAFLELDVVGWQLGLSVVRQYAAS
jgi:hypothetical protein